MRGWLAMRAQWPPRNADCRGGVFATRRFPRPPPPCAYQGRGKNPCETTRRAASLSAFTPFPLIKDLCHIHIIDAARRVATVFGKWGCLIETDLRARREKPPKKIEPIRGLAEAPLGEYGGLNPILPFLGGRSDAACRVVVCLHAFPIDNRINLQDARIGWQCARNGIPYGT